MRFYLDTSALVKLYVLEEKSKEIVRFVSAQDVGIPFSPLHHLELFNAIQLKVFRREAEVKASKALESDIESDLASGVLEKVPLNDPEVFSVALMIAKKFTHKAGCRSLDILHLALALTMSARDFLTFDDRQAKVAGKLGFRLPKI